MFHLTWIKINGQFLRKDVLTPSMTIGLLRACPEVDQGTIRSAKFSKEIKVLCIKIRSHSWRYYFKEKSL